MSKPPQQTYDVQRIIRVRVRGTQDQIVKVLDWLRAANEAERVAHPAGFGVQLGFSGPTGNDAAQWACHFYAASHLELQITTLMRDLEIASE